MTLRLTYEQRQARDAYRKDVRERKKASARQRIEKDGLRLGGPEIVIPKRPKISDAQKHRVHKAHEGKCWVCGRGLPVTGPEVQYDHVIERSLTGRDDDDALAPICTTPCHAEKTAKFLTTLGHVKRMGAKLKGKKKSGKKIPSRPFSDDYQPLVAGRGFARRPNPPEEQA